MWVRRGSEEWKLILSHAEIAPSDVTAFTNLMFANESRTSTKSIGYRCETLGRIGTFGRETMRLAMQICDAYDFATADRWQGSHRVGQYLSHISNFAFADEERKS